MKSERIKFLIDIVLKKYHDLVQIKDYWDSDLNAIGFTGKIHGRLVYVAVGEYRDYYIALEYPSKDEDMPYEPGEDFENASLEKVLDTINIHLLLGEQENQQR